MDDFDFSWLLDPEERDPVTDDPRTWEETIADEMWEERKQQEADDRPGGH